MASPSASVAAPPGGVSGPLSGFSWGLLECNIPDGELVDDWLGSIGEVYIMKGLLQISTAGKVKNRVVLLTEQSWIEVKTEVKVEPPALVDPSTPASVTRDREKKHTSLLEIHSVELDATDSSSFLIHFFSGSASAIAKKGWSNFKRLAGAGTNFGDFLKTKRVRAHSAQECAQWMLVLTRLVRNLWQRQLESTLLPAPEVYKRHAFVIKGAHDRLVLLSDHWFFNVDVEYKPIAVKAVKWAIPVSSFVSVTQVNNRASPDQAVMTISFDEAEARRQFDAHHRNNKGSELKSKNHEFVFRTREERQRFVDSIAAVFWQVTRRKLNVLNKEVK